MAGLAHHRQGAFHRLKVSQRLAASLPAFTLVLTFIVDFSFLGYVALPAEGSAHHQPRRFHRLKVSQRFDVSLPALTWVLTFISQLLALMAGFLDATRGKPARQCEYFTELFRDGRSPP